MKKYIITAAALFLFQFGFCQLNPQLGNANRNINVTIKTATLQDTLNMLIAKIAELEANAANGGGKKTIKNIVPAAGNMCFPFKNSKYPSETFYQGVIVDDVLCNNNPDAVLVVTVKTETPQQAFPVSVSYDAADGRWKISVMGYMVGSLAKNVKCFNFDGKDQSMCPQSGLYNDVGVMDPVTLSPNYNNKISFNVMISAKAVYPLPKIKRIGG